VRALPGAQTWRAEDLPGLQQKGWSGMRAPRGTVLGCQRGKVRRLRPRASWRGRDRGGHGLRRHRGTMRLRATMRPASLCTFNACVCLDAECPCDDACGAGGTGGNVLKACIMNDAVGAAFADTMDPLMEA
jgi:hypothetical protein